MDRFVILHNIRSAHNVGSVFRTADGAGVKKIYLTGYTPAPVDRFGRINPRIQKTALGATDSVPWESHEDIHTLIAMLKKEDVAVIAVEQVAQAIPYTTWSQSRATAFIFGNEIEGVPDEVCVRADACIEIPMQGLKESLNVSVTAGIILFTAR